jgi:hypothetical protein
MDLRTAYAAVEAAASQLDGYAEVTLNDEQDGLLVYFTDDATTSQRAAVEGAAPGTPVDYRIADLSDAAVTRLRDAVRSLIPELDALGFSIRSFGLATFGGHFQILYASDLPGPPAILMSVINEIAPDRVDLVRGTVEALVRFRPRAPRRRTP